MKLMKYFWILLLLLPIEGIAKQPIGFKKWRLDNDTTFAKQIGGAVRNYQRPDQTWDSIVNIFETEGDSVVYVDKSVLRARVNKNNGTSKVMLTWDGQEYTIEQEMNRISWLKISTRQSLPIDTTMDWGNFSVDSNICKWTGVSPGVDYRVRKNNGTVEHGIFFKPAFLDSAVILYNQRPDSLDIALANVMIYTLSANIDNADSAMGDLFWRNLKDFGYYNFKLTNQHLWFPGWEDVPRIPVKQYWEWRGTKIVCVEYVMMSKIKQVHEAYPSATIWHNDTKKIEGTTNVEDAGLQSGQPDLNLGSTTDPYIYQTTHHLLVRVKNVASELGENATISACVCTLFAGQKWNSGNHYVYRVFKPWNEGTMDIGDPPDEPFGEGMVTWNDWSTEDEEWTTEGCLCARDGGVDNNYDGGVCNQDVRADRKETPEDTETIDVAQSWYGWDISAALAQGWYDGTINEEGIIFISDGNAGVRVHSTEGTNPLFWVLTYTIEAEAAGTIIFINQ